MRRGSFSAVLVLTVTMLAAAQPGHALGPEYAFKRGMLGGSHDRVLAATATDIFMGDPGKASERGGIDRYTLRGSGPTQTWDHVERVNADTAGTGLGSALALEGDLLVAGAPGLEGGYFSPPGSVVVYRVGQTLEKIEELRPPDPSGGQRFGASVAIDGTTIVVGSSDKPDLNGNIVGAAYVYQPAGGDIANGWTLQTEIPNPAAGSRRFADGFGSDIGTAAGIIAVGAPFAKNDAGIATGAISIFRRSGSGYAEVQRIRGVTGGDRVGSALDIEVGRLLFGIPGRESAEIHRLDAASGTFVLWTALTPLSVTEEFGYSVDLLGNKALVGAPSTNRSGQDSGDAYGYRLRGTTWSPYFWPSAGLDAYERTGRSVALAGDRTVLLSWGQDRTNMAYGVMGYMDTDFTAPVVRIEPPPPPATPADDVAIQFTLSDDVTPASALIVECSRNNGSWAACSSPATFTDLPELKNKLSVRVRDEAGNVAVTSASVHVDQTVPRLAGEQSPQPNEHGWNNSEVTVTWVCRDPAAPGTRHPGSGILRCNPPTTISSEGAGQSALGRATDRAGNEGAERYAPINIDTTPPGVRDVKPEANAYGWYQQSVWISFFCADALSGVLRCPSGELVGEGITTRKNKAVDMAGNERIITGTYYVDQTRPIATLTSATPAANDAGWNRSPVTLSWTCTDALSGALSATNSITVADTAPLDPPVSMMCEDRASNIRRIGHVVRIDDDSPVVTMRTPAPFLAGSVTGTMSDTESGIARIDVVAVAHFVGQSATLPARCAATCSQWVASTASLPRGVYTIYAVAVDAAGNTAQSSQHVVFQVG